MTGEYKCGYTLQPGDPVAIADAMEKAQAEQKQLLQMGKNGPALAEREFDCKLLSNQFVKWLEGSVDDSISTVKQG